MSAPNATKARNLLGRSGSPDGFEIRMVLKTSEIKSLKRYKLTVGIDLVTVCIRTYHIVNLLTIHYLSSFRRVMSWLRLLVQDSDKPHHQLHQRLALGRVQRLHQLRHLDLLGANLL